MTCMCLAVFGAKRLINVRALYQFARQRHAGLATAGDLSAVVRADQVG